jgi:hypothetical protein
MAARVNKIRHDEETRRFYVYELSDGSSVQYVGKGIGRRLRSQIARTGLFGEIVRRFKTEREAYRYEVQLIAKLSPPLNRNGGGGGNRTSRRAAIVPKWMRDIEAIGTRVYAARVLLRFDLSPYCDAAQIDSIRRVASMS